MASYENLATIDSWAYRPTLPDTWFADYIARDSETLTKALQESISGDDAVSPFLNLLKHDVTSAAAAVTTSTVCGHSGGSDQESAPKRRVVGATGKVSKRKSRASKRSQTTFITADQANFRQMVQQVTGVRFGGSKMITMAPVLKPEPQRLPTLDTSAFLLDHHQEQVVVGQNSGAGLSGPGPMTFGTPIGMVDGYFANSEIDFDTISSFPTLESWKVNVRI